MHVHATPQVSPVPITKFAGLTLPWRQWVWVWNTSRRWMSWSHSGSTARSGSGGRPAKLSPRRPTTR